MNVATGDLYFRVQVPCGQSWPGMRHSDDVRIVMDRAMDHEEKCRDCITAKRAEALA